MTRRRRATKRKSRRAVTHAAANGSANFALPIAEQALALVLAQIQVRQWVPVLVRQEDFQMQAQASQRVPPLRVWVPGPQALTER